MRCCFAPVSSTRSKSERICGARIREMVRMAWFLELKDILSSNITSGGLVS